MKNFKKATVEKRLEIKTTGYGYVYSSHPLSTPVHYQTLEKVWKKAHQSGSVLMGEKIRSVIFQVRVAMFLAM